MFWCWAWILAMQTKRSVCQIGGIINYHHVKAITFFFLVGTKSKTQTWRPSNELSFKEICPKVKLDGETGRPAIRGVKWLRALRSAGNELLWRKTSLLSKTLQSGGNVLSIWGKLSQMWWADWRHVSRESRWGGGADLLTGFLPWGTERGKTYKQWQTGVVTWERKGITTDIINSQLGMMTGNDVEDICYVKL